MFLYLSLIETEEDKIKFEAIFNNYKKIMYYVANSILKDEHYSHDAVQNSFLKIIKHIDKIEDVKCNKTKGFIVTIVRNSSIDIYRKLQMEKNKVQKLENEILSFEQEVYDTDILPNKVEVAILKLPELYKQVFFLKYSHGVHDDKIADMLDISPSTVRTRIKRGKEKLKIILEQIPDEEDIDYEYPKEFEKKIKKIIKKEKRGLFLNKICLYTKKIAVVFIAFLISLFTITMSVEALRVKLFDMVKEVYEKFTIYKFKIDENDNKKVNFLEKKSINYLPNGFEEVERAEYNNDVAITYSDGEDYITFNYLLIENSNLYMDIENAKINKVQINNFYADYIEKENKSRLVWQDENILYDLKLDYTNKDKYLDIKSELIKIAKNIN